MSMEGQWKQGSQGRKEPGHLQLGRCKVWLPGSLIALLCFGDRVAIQQWTMSGWCFSCICVHFQALRWPLLPPAKLQLLVTAMGATAYWKISFLLPLLITLTTITTHNRESGVEKAILFKGEESSRKIAFSCSARKKLTFFFLECKCLLQHIKVTVDLIWNSVGVLLISKYKSSTVLGLFWLFS